MFFVLFFVSKSNPKYDCYSIIGTIFIPWPNMIFAYWSNMCLKCRSIQKIIKRSGRGLFKSSSFLSCFPFTIKLKNEEMTSWHRGNHVRGTKTRTDYNWIRANSDAEILQLRIGLEIGSGWFQFLDFVILKAKKCEYNSY